MINQKLTKSLWIRAAESSNHHHQHDQNLFKTISASIVECTNLGRFPNNDLHYSEWTQDGAIECF